MKLNSISNDDPNGEQRTTKSNVGTIDEVIHAMLDINKHILLDVKH